MSDFFRDEKGKLSNMRLMAFLSLLTSVAISVILTATGTPVDGNHLILIGLYLTASFGGKSVQKLAEMKV